MLRPHPGGGNCKHDVKKLTAVCESTCAPFVKKWPAPSAITFAPSMNDESVIVATVQLCHGRSGGGGDVANCMR